MAKTAPWIGGGEWVEKGFPQVLWKTLWKTLWKMVVGPIGRGLSQIAPLSVHQRKILETNGLTIFLDETIGRHGFLADCQTRSCTC